MRRVTSILILLTCLALLPVPPVAAGFFDNTLVSIDGNNYSVDDFKRWWKFWNTDDSPLPQTPTPYIDWLLLSREGKHMELDVAPGFKRQTRVFLQSRTLLMLKYDTINSRVNVTDADIKTRYEERFLPRWLVQRLEFKDDKTASAAWQELAAGTLTVTELLIRDAEQGGPESTSENWVRLNAIDPGWAAIFQNMKTGDVVDPIEHEQGPVLFYLKEQKGGDEEDLSKWRKEIEKTLWKEQENDLSLALLTELHDKYQVKVDEERLAALDINAAEDTFTDAAVITTSQKNVSEKELMVVIRRLVASRPTMAHAAADEEETRKLKAETISNIIAQSVTNWESLDRHYEEKEPFKWEYDFNYNHRVVLALEQRLFSPAAKVTEEEIKQHFEENISRYKQPTVVKLYIIDETQGPIDQIWADVAVGKDFKQVLKEYQGQPVAAQEAPANHLDPEVKGVVDNLGEGEMSPIFMAQGIRVMVYLEKRIPEAPLPFERVKESIRSRLFRQKLNQVSGNYLDELKSRSKIEFNKRKWQAIQKELGGA